MIPLFDGEPIFQQWCTVTPPGYRRPRETYGTFGLPGLEGQDCGLRGGTSTIRGTLFGAGSYYGFVPTNSLAAAEGLVRSYQDGQAYTFLDSLGQTWPNVKLDQFQPIGRIGQAPNGTLYRKFLVRLLHLQ
jgi:hypothetical protein